MKLLAQALSLIAALAGFAKAQRVGDPPPALVWNKLKGNCPAALDWPSLRGSVVIVSFSLDPIGSDEIVEWNEAVQKFPTEGVLFIQVIGGSEFLLDRALGQTAFKGCLLFDSDLVNHLKFDLPPHGRSVVVDRLSVIAGYSSDVPGEDAIRSVLNGELDTPLLKAPPQSHSSNPAAGLDPVPSYEVYISLAPSGWLRALGEGGPGRYISKNFPLKLIIMDLWDTPIARIEFPENLDKGNYDVTAHIPVADREVLLRTVREAVETRFGLRVGKEERTQRVYLLTAGPNPSPNLRPAISGEQSMGGGGQGAIFGTALAMPEIAHTFEDLLNVPVIDATGWKGTYDYSASSKLSGSEAALDLAHRLGLELTATERPIEMLVVRKVQ